MPKKDETPAAVPEPAAEEAPKAMPQARVGAGFFPPAGGFDRASLPKPFGRLAQEEQASGDGS